MSSLISCNQSVFLLGWLISNNILVANELLYFMQSQKKGSTRRMTIKLDMSKAYDWIECPFLEVVMQALGFQPPLIKFIMSYVTLVQYRALVSERPGRIITPSWELYQGDPLSPYLFIMCTEGLSSILSRAKQQGRIQGASITCGGTRVNHLIFVDDCILHSRASLTNWEEIREILSNYEKGSG